MIPTSPLTPFSLNIGKISSDFSTDFLTDSMKVTDFEKSDRLSHRPVTLSLKKLTDRSLIIYHGHYRVFIFISNA